ncbi:MAG: transposase [Alphaproteobacteria bacterium]|nr:transposase [Alphaproteobacteria bacterium]
MEDRTIYEGESSRKLQGEFQELRKRYWRQHLWAKGCFVAMSGQISTKEVQK